jgi:hypothetical protein
MRVCAICEAFEGIWQGIFRGIFAEKFRQKITNFMDKKFDQIIMGIPINPYAGLFSKKGRRGAL